MFARCLQELKKDMQSKLMSTWEYDEDFAADNTPTVFPVGDSTTILLAVHREHDQPTLWELRIYVVDEDAKRTRRLLHTEAI